MTQIEWQQLEAAVAAMTDDEKKRLAALLSDREEQGVASAGSSIIGLFADEPELIEQIIQDTYRARETDPFRMGE